MKLKKEDQVLLVRGQKRFRDALLILRYAAAHKQGVTCDECAVDLGLDHQSCSPRFSELVSAGCLLKTKEKRPTRHGRPANVHKIANYDFKVYLKWVASKKARKNRTSPKSRDRALLKACEVFLSNWNRTLPADEQAKLLRKLVRSLEKADSVAERLGNTAKQQG